jgi:hypothetical protein
MRFCTILVHFALNFFGIEITNSNAIIVARLQGAKSQCEIALRKRTAKSHCEIARVNEATSIRLKPSVIKLFTSVISELL